MNTTTTDTIYNTIKLLLPELNALTIKAMTSAGVDSNSNLVKSINYVQTQDSINLEAAYYFTYVSTGRRSAVKKVPVMNLIDWMKKKNIVPKGSQTYNQLAFAISESIYKHGIKPKNYIDTIIQTTADLSAETLADNVAESIADDTANAMSKI